jgi:hypothetical protein
MKPHVGIVSLLIVSLFSPASAQDDLLFIHHSTGGLWLNRGLEAALLAKPYLDERNDVTYGTQVTPDADRPDSLAPVPGDLTDMKHWILWFNDYIEHLHTQSCEEGRNRIVMFKSCFPNSHLSSDGSLPGDPFSGIRTVTNYQAVYRHLDGTESVYIHGGWEYAALEAVFERHPRTLFIPVTAPPLHFAPADATDDAAAHRARTFNQWLQDTWQPAYETRTGFRNVVVFDWFDVLAYPDDHSLHPNRLREEYGGASGDSHPNNLAMEESTTVFATGAANFLDAAWERFLAYEPEGEGEGEGGPPTHAADLNGDDALNMREILRVIQFFSSSAYQCDPAGEDGYNPGEGPIDCRPHDSDYAPQDWTFSLTEILRAIQFFNSGVCRPCADDETEDGFCCR